MRDWKIDVDLKMLYMNWHVITVGRSISGKQAGLSGYDTTSIEGTVWMGSRTHRSVTMPPCVTRICPTITLLWVPKYCVFVKTKRIDGSPNRCTFETRDPKSMIIPLRGNFSHSRHRALDGIDITVTFGWYVYAVKIVVFRILGLRGGMWNRHGMFNLNLVTVSEMR